jgi:hypothetical protein
MRYGRLVGIVSAIAGGRSVRADSTERRRPLPGDDFIPTPVETLTHAISIAAPPGLVWGWVVQMGAGTRAGWYSYDRLDNGGRESAARLIPELQEVAVGTVFPALPGITEGFVVHAFHAGHWLVLAWPGPGERPSVTWTFVLEPDAVGTRLLVRARAGPGYRFRGLPQWTSLIIVRLVHFLMERRQLLGIAQRAERARGVGHDRA